MTNLNKYPGTV